MPPSDNAPDLRSKGILRRYEVTRVDGQEDPPETLYLVLKYSAQGTTAMNTAALRAYAAQARVEGYETLANEIETYLTGDSK